MVGSPQFYELMEAKLLEIIFVLNSELLSLCAWSFAVNQHTFKANLFMKKLEEAFPQQIKNSSIRDMSRIVWSMCRTKGPDSPLLDQIEQEINQRQLSGKDCAHVLWGYILNKPLQGKTLEKLVKTILSQKEQLDSWDVSTIIWSFSKYEKHDIFKFIYIELYDQVMEVIDEMNNEELLQVIRSYIETQNETQELVDESREILQENLLQLSYDQVILCIHLYTSMTQANIDNELKEFIMQLKKRAEEMVRLQVISNDLQKEVDIHSVEYYEKLQKLDELKQ
ncbi:hypothetical protein PPERSA_08212 [Pseudocohnilembus persalinus]|uniref:Uncharacterized protein n=1 Tax=Pseudocohnilembus persalinus TaxID=266149 RepID=A0A0V0QFZ7_PSEPJ|nr:hypothetical protein PPERSA_08212 [Pseudocohnilembus persalinus]|eukprot:KRX01111.1 hypothetical protein PPERSA_08212 [Pseudocohnilembus persalinus]